MTKSRASLMAPLLVVFLPMVLQFARLVRSGTAVCNQTPHMGLCWNSYPYTQPNLGIAVDLSTLPNMSPGVAQLGLVGKVCFFAPPPVFDIHSKIPLPHSYGVLEAEARNNEVAMVA